MPLSRTEIQDLFGAVSGIFYGYPDCCIRAFMTPDRGTNHPLIGTGYIPCKACEKKTMGELITVIDRNRFCEVPFPHGLLARNDRVYYEFEAFLDELCQTPTA